MQSGALSTRMPDYRLQERDFSENSLTTCPKKRRESSEEGTGEKRRHIWSSPGLEISTSKMSFESSEASLPDTAAHSSSNIHRRAGSTQLSGDTKWVATPQ